MKLMPTRVMDHVYENLKKTVKKINSMTLILNGGLEELNWYCN